MALPQLYTPYVHYVDTDFYWPLWSWLNIDVEFKTSSVKLSEAPDLVLLCISVGPSSQAIPFTLLLQYFFTMKFWLQLNYKVGQIIHHPPSCTAFSSSFLNLLSIWRLITLSYLHFLEKQAAFNLDWSSSSVSTLISFSKEILLSYPTKNLRNNKQRQMITELAVPD